MTLYQDQAVACARVAFPAVAIFAMTASCLAAAQPALSDSLQQEAMTCVSEAMQICPDVWTAEDHGLACMTGKRASFSSRCRVIYDKVDNALHPSSSKVVSRHDRAHPPEEQ